MNFPITAMGSYEKEIGHLSENVRFINAIYR